MDLSRPELVPKIVFLSPTKVPRGVKLMAVHGIFLKNIPVPTCRYMIVHLQGRPAKIAHKTGCRGNPNISQVTGPGKVSRFRKSSCSQELGSQFSEVSTGRVPNA